MQSCEFVSHQFEQRVSGLDIAVVKNFCVEYTVWHKILAGENFGEFGKTNVICQYFTQIH